MWHCGAPELAGCLAGRLGFGAEGRRLDHVLFAGRQEHGTATTSNGTTTFCDAGGNTTARSFTTGNTKTNYDSRGNVISRETTTGNTTTVYDPAGRNVGRFTAQPFHE